MSVVISTVILLLSGVSSMTPDFGFGGGSSAIERTGDIPSAAEQLAEDYDTLACTNENKTYTVDLKLHADSASIKALHAVAKVQISDTISELEAVNAYFGTIIDEINTEMIKFKVQMHLNLNSYNSDDFMGNIVSDQSCEVGSPIAERTANAFEYLKKSFESNIGLHMFIWSCIHIPNNAELHTVLSNLKCGRTVGVLWSGTLQTRNIIKFAILKALTDAEHEYSASMKFDDMVIGPQLCKYVTNCVGLGKNEVGQLVWGTEMVRYTDQAENDPYSGDSGYGEDPNKFNRNAKGLVHVH